MNLDPTLPLLATALVALLLTALVFRLRRAGGASRPARREALDTVQDWQPEPARVLTVSERQALERLQKALPGFVVLAQVPLSRFLRVPTAHSYTEWLQRVGSLSADLLLCDASSRVLAVIDIRAAHESERAKRRHERMSRVLRAARIGVHAWREDALPEVPEIRALLGAQLGASRVRAAAEAAPARSSRPSPLIPVADIAEVLAEGDLAATERTDVFEPVPSAFFDDMETAPTAMRR